MEIILRKENENKRISFILLSFFFIILTNDSFGLFHCTGGSGDRGSTVVKVLCYKSEGRWFGLSWCQWIFY